MVPSLDRKAELLELPMEPAMDGQGPGAAGAGGEGEAGAERDPEGALQQRRCVRARVRRCCLLLGVGGRRGGGSASRTMGC